MSAGRRSAVIMKATPACGNTRPKARNDADGSTCFLQSAGSRPEPVDFFARIGFAFYSEFTSELAGCMNIGENTSVMLVTEAFFEDGLAGKRIADCGQSVEAVAALSLDSREQVDLQGRPGDRRRRQRGQ